METGFVSEQEPQKPSLSIVLERRLIQADAKIIDAESELIEPFEEERTDFMARAKYARDLAYLAGMREGLSIARKILSEESKTLDS